jgi:hypothetical protein
MAPRRVAPEPQGTTVPPHAEKQSNAEITPSKSQSGEALRRRAEEHPASDAEAAKDHAAGRRSDDPTGLSTEPTTDEISRRDE